MADGFGLNKLSWDLKNIYNSVFYVIIQNLELDYIYIMGVFIARF